MATAGRPATPEEVAALKERYPDQDCAGAVAVDVVETSIKNARGMKAETAREQKFRLSNRRTVGLPVSRVVHELSPAGLPAK